MGKATHDQLVGAVVHLACEAGESGFPLLEVGLTLIVRAGRFSLPIRSLLATLGTIILTIIDVLIDEGQRDPFNSFNREGS